MKTTSNFQTKRFDFESFEALISNDIINLVTDCAVHLCPCMKIRFQCILHTSYAHQSESIWNSSLLPFSQIFLLRWWFSLVTLGFVYWFGMKWQMCIAFLRKYADTNASLMFSIHVKYIVSQLYCFGEHQSLLFKKKENWLHPNEYKLHQNRKSNGKFHFEVE